MSMVKALVGAALRLCLSPLRLRRELLHYTRGVVLSDPSEHLYRATRYIKAQGRYSTKGAYVLDIGAADGGSAQLLQ